MPEVQRERVPRVARLQPAPDGSVRAAPDAVGYPIAARSQYGAVY